MTSFLASLLGIPVDLGRTFGSKSCILKGEELSGDPEMLPTFVTGFWSFLNPVRNALLARFIWRKYSLLKIRRVSGVEYRLAYMGGDHRWMVITTKFFATYVAVKHGRESCRFAIIGADGEETAFEVLARGSKEHILRTVINDLRSELPNTHKLTIEQAENIVIFV